jgi:hypothetical protein
MSSPDPDPDMMSSPDPDPEASILTGLCTES